MAHETPARDTLSMMCATAHDVLLCLAFAFEDYGRPDVKNAVLNVRKRLIDATGPQAMRK